MVRLDNLCIWHACGGLPAAARLSLVLRRGTAAALGSDVSALCRYILVYPQGCDVCNHLSLFLCVADYEKLLPGWSHFAQFTIAVVNSDPKKSKYSGGSLACV